MREVTISNDRKVSIKGLTRRNIKTLQEQKLPISRWGIELDPKKDRESADKLFDAVLAIGVDSSVDPDDLMPCDEQKLFMEITAETYGSRDEEKN